MILTYVQKSMKIENRNYRVIIPDNIDKFINFNCIFDADRKGIETIYFSY